MTITPYITNDFYRTSVDTEVKSLVAINGQSLHFVVFDRTIPIGVVNPPELFRNYNSKISDCTLVTDRLKSTASVDESLSIMASSGTSYLPVFENGFFCGIVSQRDLCQNLTSRLKSLEFSLSSGLQSLRKPIVNLLGIITLLDKDIPGDEREELTTLAQQTCKQAIAMVEEFKDLHVLDLDVPGNFLTEISGFIKGCIATTPLYKKGIKISFFPPDPDNGFTLSINRAKVRNEIQTQLSKLIKVLQPYSSIQLQGIVHENTYSLVYKLKSENLIADGGSYEIENISLTKFIKQQVQV